MPVFSKNSFNASTGSPVVLLQKNLNVMTQKMFSKNTTTSTCTNNEKNLVTYDSDSEFSDSDQASIGEDSRANVLLHMKRINERKQELIKRLQLHEAASELRSSLHRKQAKSKPKISKPSSGSLRRRKSIRLQGIHAPFSCVILHRDALMQMIDVKKPRPLHEEHKIQSYENNDETFVNMHHSSITRITSAFQPSSTKLDNNFEKQPHAGGYEEVLQRMNKNGCVTRRLFEKRVYSSAIHPGEDNLLVAAGSSEGTIGLWMMKSAKDRTNMGTVCSIPTYDCPVTHMLYPPAGHSKLYFSSDAGVIRSLDLAKGVFDEVLYDNQGSCRISTFDIFDAANSGILAGVHNNLLLLDPRSSSPALIVPIHKALIKSISVHPLYGHYFATSSNDCLIKIHDMRYFSSTTGCISNITDHSNAISSTYFTPSGRQLITTAADNTLRVYDSFDLSSPSLVSLKSINLGNHRKLVSVGHPSRDDIMAVGINTQPGRQIAIFNSKLDKICSLTDPKHLTSICSSFAFHPSRHVIAAGSLSSGTVFIFEG